MVFKISKSWGGPRLKWLVSLNPILYENNFFKGSIEDKVRPFSHLFFLFNVQFLSTNGGAPILSTKGERMSTREESLHTSPHLLIGIEQKIIVRL